MFPDNVILEDDERAMMAEVIVARFMGWTLEQVRSAPPDDMYAINSVMYAESELRAHHNRTLFIT